MAQGLGCGHRSIQALSGALAAGLGLGMVWVAGSGLGTGAGLLAGCIGISIYRYLSSVLRTTRQCCLSLSRLSLVV